MEMSATVSSVRRFNRFYTRAIGVLGRTHLGTDYSLTETRVLYEIAHGIAPTAKSVRTSTGLDAGYLSRIVRRLERDGLVTKQAAPADRRSPRLVLTEAGAATFRRLQERTIAGIEGLIGGLVADERGRLVGALDEAVRLLGSSAVAAEPVILRPPQAGDLGWVVQRHGALYAAEYGWGVKFEVLVARIVADFVDKLDPARERCWIAEQAGRPVGSIFLVSGERDGEAKLRLLLVEPSARGLGVGRMLTDECLAFARAAGYGAVVLWTQSILTAARGIYAKAGFERIDSYPYTDLGVDLVSETWRLEL